MASICNILVNPFPSTVPSFLVSHTELQKLFLFIFNIIHIAHCQVIKFYRDLYF